MYSNSLLATLNTRKSVRGRGTDRGTGNNGDFTIIQTASNAHVRTTHSIFGQVDWTKQPTDLEVNVLKEIVSDRGFNDVRFHLHQLSLVYAGPFDFTNLYFIVILIKQPYRRYPPSESPSTPDSQVRSAPVVRVAEGFNVADRLREPERIARF